MRALDGGVPIGGSKMEWECCMCCWPYRRYAIEDAEGRAEFHVQVPICCADGCRNCCAPTCFNPIFSMPITARGPSGLSAQLGALESHWPGGSQSRASHGRCGRCCGQYNRRFSSVWRRWLWCHLGPISRPDLGTVLARLQLARLVRRWDGEQQLRAHFPARRLGAAEGAPPLGLAPHRPQLLRAPRQPEVAAHFSRKIRGQQPRAVGERPLSKRVLPLRCCSREAADV
mmetsp:Transcript_28783/g.85669  ORF Transcript_28783/g.85669 Transcript_28783/m.85669 type:complete len:229 (+) Transcript_28783:839-1525(+)